MLNRTHIEHSIIATIIMICFSIFGGLLMMVATPAISNLFMAGCIASGVFFAREHAQAEAKLKDQKGIVGPDFKSSLEAMKFWLWGQDAILDVAGPIAVTIIISTIVLLLGV